jgi:hypothetical protein
MCQASYADTFAPNPSTKSEEDQRDFGYVEAKYIGENSAGKISSAAGSGGRRCEMSPEEFAKYYPPLLDWIQTTLTASAHVAQTIASRGFSRLPLYLLAKDERPVPPLPIDARQAAARDHARSLSELADTAARDSARCQSSGAALGSQAYKKCRALLEDKMSIENDVPPDRSYTSTRGR